MRQVLGYWMTVWYGPAYDDVGNRGVLTVESYFKASLEGSRHENRQELADIGVPFFQERLREWYGISVPEDKIKVRFDRETNAQTPSGSIQVDSREMTYRGKGVSARKLPSHSIPLDEDDEKYDTYDGLDSEHDDLDGFDLEGEEDGDDDEEW